MADATSSDGPTFNPLKSTYTLFDEFRNFAFKGNVVDLAVGVVIGGAFGGLVKSLVDNIIMPLIAAVTPSSNNYAEWTIPLNGQQLHPGLFLAQILNFLILAAVLFIFIVKFLGWIMHSRKAEAAAPPPPPSADVVLLTEIRDLLKQQASRQ
jgi:large conductance mechanosensitive channel